MLWNCPSIYAEEEWYISLCMNSILQPTLDWSKFSMCSMKLQDKSSTLKFGNWKGQHFFRLFYIGRHEILETRNIEMDNKNL